MTHPNTDSVLFTPRKIGSLTIRNRFIRSATHESMAEKDGRMSSRHLELFRALAEGEVGLIITGHAYVERLGIASPGQTGIDDDADVESLRRITDTVHETPSKIFLQIAHAGRQTKVRLAGGIPVGPSPVYDPVFKITPRELSSDEIRALIDRFISAARRAVKAGFDGVQVHAAHGYLLSSFLSPHTNRRKDEWGGTVENRVRVIVEILRGIQKDCGPGFPVIAKINATDHLTDGLTLEEAIIAAKILEAEGLAAAEVSGGMSEAGLGSVWPGLRKEEDEGYFLGYAAAFKAALRIPVSGLGGNRTFSVMERFVREGKADLISLSRPLVREPDLVRRFRLGLTGRSECISCNKCFNPRGLACYDIKI